MSDESQSETQVFYKDDRTVRAVVNMSVAAEVHLEIDPDTGTIAMRVREPKTLESVLFLNMADKVAAEELEPAVLRGLAKALVTIFEQRLDPKEIKVDPNAPPPRFEPPPGGAKA